MPELEVHSLLSTKLLAVCDVRCAGTCHHRSAEECTSATCLVFPYSGVYVRHVGREQAIGDANHVLFFNATEGYQVSHPVRGGDRNLSVRLADDLLRELAPAQTLSSASGLRFRRQHQRIGVDVQAMGALLRHQLTRGTLDELAGEIASLTLVSCSLGPRTSHEPRATPASRRLVDRVKLLLSGDLSRRWRLAEIGTEMGSSPVYLTQLFQKVEGLPLYRYHLRLRLARALQLVPHYEDLTALALELGFSSHAHFTATFRQAYGRTPSEFKRTVFR